MKVAMMNALLAVLVPGVIAVSAIAYLAALVGWTGAANKGAKLPL